MADAMIEVPPELRGFIQYGIECHHRRAEDEWEVTKSRDDLKEFGDWDALSRQGRSAGGTLRLAADPSRLQQLTRTAMFDLSDELRTLVGAMDPPCETIHALLGGLNWLATTFDDLGATATQAVIDAAESATEEAAS
jgi:hypothetical protein